jgi:hypothetical protein
MLKLALGPSPACRPLLARVDTVSPSAVSAGRHEPPAMAAMGIRPLTSLLAPGVAVAGHWVKSAAQVVGLLVILCCRVLVDMMYLG